MTNQLRPRAAGPRRVALVTGASRGVGAEVACRLGAQGWTVIVAYREKRARAQQVLDSIRSAGGVALGVSADLTCDSGIAAIARAVRGTGTGLDALVLNASGGLEQDRPLEYAMAINRDAQLRLVNELLPLLAAGARIVFVTSHWAHFHGQLPGIAEYEPVAVSKRAGEDALRARLSNVAPSEASLVVVTGDVIEGTITPRLLERARPGILDDHRQSVGSFPTVEEFAAVIVQAATDPTVASGTTLQVNAKVTA